MTHTTRVLVLVGSLRADSHNRRIAEAIRTNAPGGVTVEIAEGLGELPFYNEDIDGGQAPAAAVRLREQVTAADRILVVTPEYNGTMPAVLNNAIDWVSRPYGENALRGKPLAVVGTAGGQYGGQWAHEDTRKSARVAGAAVVERIALSHAYAFGSDPLAEADTVDRFVAAVTDLASYDASGAAA
ncbi:FMN reductase [Nocardioides silvaticus]|uniref:FMN reductase n=1 Tax=Nocardioides silvaticus TaxID=2201891 RepID=A0A316TMF1_9ACTN|nr:NAD(P)H-dependent oxidoreductase [Nocardioides silvaticus]PWN00916.1 FMN reductase [Nocardioides silvaticus]